LNDTRIPGGAANVAVAGGGDAAAGVAEVSYRLGSALLEKGKMKPARAELQRANGLAQAMPETLYALGKACLADGDLAASEKHWLALLEMERETALAEQAHFGLAGIYRRQGIPEKAEKHMREYHRLRIGAGKCGRAPSPGCTAEK